MPDNEVPEPDLAEQHQPWVDDDEPDPVAETARERRFDVDDADLLEQHEELPMEDDDRR